MKKFLLMIICIMILFNASTYTVYANDNSYAQITSENGYLYRNPTSNPDISNIWCKLEQTYFVEIINDYNDDFYKVNYNSIIGFIKKSEVKEITNTPISPYPSNINIKINSTSGCYLRELPISKTTTSNIIKTIDKGTNNLLFVGYAYGDECIDLKGSLWYLVKHNNDIGYIYSDFVENKVTIYPNIEEVSFHIKDYTSSMLNPLSDTSTLITTIIITIPCIFILILLFTAKPKLNKSKPKKYNIKEIDLTEVTDIYNDLDV